MQSVERRRSSFPDPAAPVPRTLPSALRDRLRIALLAGLALATAGSLLPWIHTWLPYVGDVNVSGLERAGDAALILQIALVVFVLTWSDRAWNSRTTLLVGGPVALGVLGLLILRVAFGDATIYIRSLALYGGHGSIEPGLWITVAGMAIATSAGGIHLFRARARLSFRPGITWAAVAAAIGGAGGLVVGFTAGVWLAERLTAGALRVVSSSLVVVFALVLGFLGAMAGSRAASGLVRARRG